MPAVTKSRNDEEVLNPTAMAVHPENLEIGQPKIFVPEELPEYIGPVTFAEDEPTVKEA